MIDEIIVSVCMITYNHEKYISDAIESVIMQKTSFRYELVIGDDLSSDGTRRICEEYANKYPYKIRLLFTDKNNGVTKNFIRTLSACTGKYIALCEGDDYWTDENKLQKQVDILENNKEYVICFHDVVLENNGLFLADNITKDVSEISDIYDLSKGNYMHTATVLYRNKMYDKLPDNFVKVYAADYYLHMINAQYGRLIKIKEKMSVYRMHDASYWSSIDAKIKRQRDINDKLVMISGINNIYIRIRYIKKLFLLIIKNVL